MQITLRDLRRSVSISVQRVYDATTGNDYDYYHMDKDLRDKLLDMVITDIEPYTGVVDDRYSSTTTVRAYIRAYVDKKIKEE